MGAQGERDRRLGRGLESLLGGGRAAGSQTDGGEGGPAREVGIGSIRTNPMQPRRGFHGREMEELTASVKSVGVLQPLLVRKSGSGYELIAGERRLRAATAAGLKTVPVIERDTSDDQMLTLALVENLQREDLNPIEKARGFKQLIEDYNLTQEEAAKRIGKDRSTVANFIRLLDLPEVVQHVVSRGTISMGHARALLSLPHASTQQALALRIENEGLSVRETERIVAKARPSGKKPGRAAPTPKDPHIRDLEDRIRELLGTKVAIEYHAGKGKLTVFFHSDSDLQHFLDAVGIGHQAKRPRQTHKPPAPDVSGS